MVKSHPQIAKMSNRMSLPKVGIKMPDEHLDVLVVRKIPDGTFAAVDALQELRVAQDAFKSAAEARKFIEDFYLARGIIRRRTLKE
jgi:hypothetical protein